MSSHNKVNDLQNISERLSAAISAGDQSQAKQYAALLAAKAAELNIELLSPDPLCEEKDPSFSLRVHIEDRESSGSSINMTVRATDSISSLKKRMQIKHRFPAEVQKWIVGKRIPKDDETLRKCGIKDSGHSVYLYLVSAKSAGITKETFESNLATGFLKLDALAMPTVGRQISNVSSASGASLSPLIQDMTSRVPPSKQPSQLPVPEETTLTPDIPIPPVDQNVNRKQNKSSNLQPPSEIIQPGRKSPIVHSEPEESCTMGWQCSKCTYINSPTRPGCQMCTEPRPVSYKIPDGYVPTHDEQRRLELEEQVEHETLQAEKSRKRQQKQRSEQHYNVLMEMDNQDLVENQMPFECPICFDLIPPGHGAVLRECLHSFCKSCLKATVQYNEEAALRCPYQDDIYACAGLLQDREVKALVTKEAFEKYLQRSLKLAESQAENSFHCRSTDCPGWCLYEDHVNFFVCPVCKKENCLTCKAIHMGINCHQYQEDLKIRASNDVAARRTQESLTQMIVHGEAMHCPQCQVVIQKKEGCDWIKCSICKTEICWVTKGPRWGPAGPGDVSGGCRCNVNGRRCDPNCNNCH